MIDKITVLGAGSWGTALAMLLSEKGLDTVLWARNERHAQELADSRRNRRYLDGFDLPRSLKITSNLEKALDGCQALLFVVPSHGMRQTARQVARLMDEKNPPIAIVSCAKGVENGTLKTMTEVLEDELPKACSPYLSVLSGPSFAKEVAQKMPTAVTVASSSHEVSAMVQQLFHTPFFRVYCTYDTVGVQLGGAVKNVLAIAAGISDGLGFGTNSRAALITRGLAEMSRLGLKMGANPLTFSGLAGLGDLVLTCTGELSRNRQVGLKLGRGMCMDEILASMSMVAEGVKTSRSLHELAQKHDVEMPIIDNVYKVIYEGMDPRDCVSLLLSRPLKHELYGVD